MPNIEVEGVTWETPLKGHKLVTLDDGREEEKDYIRIPLPKASVKDDPAYAEICISDLPDHVYTEALLKGIQSLVNRGDMNKIKGAKTDASRAAAIEAAEKNIAALYAGQIRVSAGAKTKISGAIRTLAMQKARLLVKDAIKRAGEKISHYAAREITSAAEMILGGEHGAALIAEARAEIEAREKAAVAIDIGLLKKDESKVQKDAEKKAAKAAKPKQSIAGLAAGVQATQRKPQPNQLSR